MVLKYNFRGFMAPVFTAFNKSLEVNYEIIQEYANYLETHEVLGVLVNGTTGEGVSLNVNERKLVTEKWVKATKITGQSLMVQVGGAALIDVIDMAKHAEQNNVDALLCLPELFFKPKTVKQLTDYLKLISNAAPKTPLLYYHIPSFTDVNLDMEELIKLALIEVPTFAGIKFTHTNMEEGSRCIKISKEQGMAVFLGCDQLLSAATILGFDSTIGTTLNLWPELLNQIQSNVKQGKIQEAMDVQEELTRRISKITKYGNWVSSMKAAMNLSGAGFNMGEPRPPLVPVIELQMKDMF